MNHRMKKKSGAKPMDMKLAEIKKLLGTLRLNGMNATLETRLIQANQGASFAEVFACLVQDEVDYRSSRLCETRFKASGLTERPTLTEFDWGFNPKLLKKEIYELVSGRFVREGGDALLIREIQPEGGKRMRVDRFLCGHPLAAGTRLSPQPDRN